MASKPVKKTLRCDLIEATTATQVRKKLIPELIDQYCEDIKNGARFTAIDVWKEKGSSRYILSDGFHRLLAHIHAEIEEIKCNIHEGGMREALGHALGANSEHGQRLTNADKRHAVEMALRDPYFGQLKRQEIADLCRVTKRTVQKIANQLAVEGDSFNGNDGTKFHEPQEPTDGDHRPTAEPPTQAEIERDELRSACKVFAAFPYDGADACKLELDKDDVANLEYVSTWTASAVIALRAAK